MARLIIRAVIFGILFAAGPAAIARCSGSSDAIECRDRDSAVIDRVSNDYNNEVDFDFGNDIEGSMIEDKNDKNLLTVREEKMKIIEDKLKLFPDSMNFFKCEELATIIERISNKIEEKMLGKDSELNQFRSVRAKKEIPGFGRVENILLNAIDDKVNSVRGTLNISAEDVYDAFAEKVCNIIADENLWKTFKIWSCEKLFQLAKKFARR